MVIWSINSKESSESLPFMISLKRSSSIVKEWHIAWPGIMRQSANLVRNPIAVYNFGFLFNGWVRPQTQ